MTITVSLVVVGMLTRTDEQLNWLLERIPKSTLSSPGGRPSAHQCKIVGGVFCMFDIDTKQRDLPRRFES